MLRATPGVRLMRPARSRVNPHVYLDTVFLIGAISTQFPGFGASFAAGGMPFGGRSNRL
jgi:L-lysine exporter family protein LysE/ArgO